MRADDRGTRGGIVRDQSEGARRRLEVNAPGDANLAVVGGGGGALGAAVVARLHAAGWRVVVPAREPERVRAPTGVVVIQCALDESAAVERLAGQVEALGIWGALVNASG